MPRHTYNPKKGRRRPTQPALEHFEWIRSELRKLSAEHARNPNEKTYR